MAAGGKQNKSSKGGRPGKNYNRPTNKRYSAGRRWIANSAKRVFRHLRVHGLLNHRRRGFVKPKVEDVELFVMGTSDLNSDGTRAWSGGKMNVPEETWLKVRRLVSRFLSEVA